MTRHCSCCGKPFEPRPQVPDQSFCSAPDCQRARKRQWQRAKLQSDPDYRINQRAAQQAWSQRNQDYWRDYRDARPEYAQRNREQQRSRDLGRNGDLAKMDACDLPSGLYRITRHPALPRENGDSWVVEITPVCVTCPCKMDVSREDVIRRLVDSPVTLLPKRVLSNILHGNDSNRVRCRRAAAAPIEGAADPRFVKPCRDMARTHLKRQQIGRRDEGAAAHFPPIRTCPSPARAGPRRSGMGASHHRNTAPRQSSDH